MELLLLVLLQIKHWYIDFVNQTNDEVQCKGIYGNWTGTKHSIKHGLATALIFLIVVPLPAAIILGAIDAVIHYHVDWIKMNKGNRDITTKAFWSHLGLDQMVHQLTYILLVSIV